MKVILTEKVKNLGNTGELVNVSPGFARNFLIPRNVAIVASEGNQKFIEDQQARLQKKIEAERSAAEEVKKQLESVSLELFKKVGGSGKLFGTVTNTELAKELAGKGIELERRQILIETPIKETGDFDVKVKLFTNVEGTFKVKVSMDLKQAEEMKAKQKQAEERAAAKANAKKSAEAKAENAEGEESATEETEA